jgi:hypothetical protein
MADPNLTKPLATPKSSSYWQRGQHEFHLAVHWVWTQDLFWGPQVPEWVIPESLNTWSTWQWTTSNSIPLSMYTCMNYAAITNEIRYLWIYGNNSIYNSKFMYWFYL